MNPSLKPVIESFIKDEQLPPEYFKTVEHWFVPMVDQMLQQLSAHQGTFIVGISGCQGSGKSTLASLLVVMLNRMLGLRCINLSIDDFYLTHEQRRELGASVHPLLATRGVPGTHDVNLAVATIEALRERGSVAVPRFDKAVDNRVPRDQWPIVQGPIDVIVLEGWCLNIGPESEEALVEPVNELESVEDPDGAWRHYVNDAIQRYDALYDLVDYLVMLKAPDFDLVYEWRQRQEDKLAEKALAAANGPEENNRIMSPEQLRRFIQHYERVTRHGLETLPDKADVVFQLTDRQTIDKRL